jgi:peptidoglycan/xylan/chitin deacetylase (PgdA/CDA1 family)
MGKIILTVFILFTVFFIYPIIVDGELYADAESPIYINIQIEAEGDDAQGLKNIADELKKRDIRATIYTTAEYALVNPELIETVHGQGFELALHGYQAGERLAHLPYEEQKQLLKTARFILEGCRPCGSFRSIIGFRPQSWSQNEDTYRILDELGIIYNSSLAAGEIKARSDALPFRIEDHDFYIIPISSIVYRERRIYLCDTACSFDEEMNLKPAEWSEVMHLAITKSRENGTPLTLIFHDWYTGNREKYGYWEPFIDFLDNVEGKAIFIKTHEFVTKNLFK